MQMSVLLGLLSHLTEPGFAANPEEILRSFSTGFSCASLTTRVSIAGFDGAQAPDDVRELAQPFLRGANPRVNQARLVLRPAAESVNPCGWALLRNGDHVFAHGIMLSERSLCKIHGSDSRVKPLVA